MSENPPIPVIEKKKLKAHEHIIAALPIALVAIGGLIGGAIGGGAYVINTAIFRKEISPFKKYIYSLLVAIAACVVYLGVIVALRLMFPALFKR